MTITELARFTARNSNYQRQMGIQRQSSMPWQTSTKRQSTAEPILPNGSLPPPGHVNPYCPEGLDITGMTSKDYKIIPVSKEYEQKIRDITLEQMKKYYGMAGSGDDNPIADTIREYDKLIPAKDRINAGWTLEQIHFDEVDRLYDFVRSKVPGWHIGQAFDTSILDEYKQGIDTLA